MKKALKVILLSLSIFVVLIVLSFVVYSVKAKSETKIMTPVDTKEITDNIFAIHESFSNFYLIKDSNQYIAIDAGNQANIISEELDKLEINPEEISAVFLTHTDGDHVAAIKLFTNARVYLSAKEEQMITGETPRFLIFGNKIATNEYSLVADQEIVTIGNTQIKGISTPGHTPGSMCYLVNNTYLFTGDLFSLKEGKISKFNELFNMDTETSIKSVDNIRNLPNCEYIFTGHYGFTDNYNKAIEN